MQQGLVVAGLELVGTEEEAVGVLPDPVGDAAAGKSASGALVLVGGIFAGVQALILTGAILFH